MKRIFLIFIMPVAMTASGILHVWEYRKIQEFSHSLQLQSEIEFKRTALLVIYQQVLQNTVRELDALKRENEKRKKQNFTELFKSLPEVQP